MINSQKWLCSAIVIVSHMPDPIDSSGLSKQNRSSSEKKSYLFLFLLHYLKSKGKLGLILFYFVWFQVCSFA